MNKTLVILGGPTAVGKTETALALAEDLGTEILSADSRQCYRELNIGTAKPSPAQLNRVRHHFINSHSITETVSAGAYMRIARGIMREVFKKRDFLVMAGGTGLYIRAALEGIDEMPEPLPGIRQQLNDLSLPELQELVQENDPEYAEKADMKNPQRLVRALEVTLSAGKPYSSFLNRKKDLLPYRVVKIALSLDRDQLYDRINRRVDRMVEHGLFSEVKELTACRSHYALKTVGYREVFDYLDSRVSRDEAIAQIKQNTRRYAKRQLTWFRKNGEFEWFSPENGPEIVQFVREKSHLGRI